MRRDRTRLWVAGAATGAAGMVVAQATVWALRAEIGPVESVAAAVRDGTPGVVAVRLVHLVGHLDKPLLVGGTVAILLAICGLAGALSRRRMLYADLIFLALAAIGLLAIQRQPNATVASAVAVIAGLVTWLLVLRVLVRPTLTGSQSRRDFLLRTGGVVVGAGVLAVAGRWVGRGRRKVEQARRLLRLPVTPGTEPPHASLGVRGIAPWRTPNGDFYRIDTTLVPPAIQPTDWQLRIHGMVDQEVTVTYQDLVGRPFAEGWVTLACVSNEVGGDLIGNAWWSGVPVRELLAQAGIQQGADAVLQTSQDGWTCGTPLAALTDDRNALLAVAMNGRPLPVEHGFPVRMVVPGLYGYVSATKWLVDLEVTRFDEIDAYWTKRGWAEEGPIKTQSRIDVPRDDAEVTAGPLRIGGSAWAQHTGIERVEFQLDGGPWRTADLGAVPKGARDTWVQWTGQVEVGAGRHTLVVRATDAAGRTQTAVRSDVLPDGATGWHTVTFDAS